MYYLTYWVEDWGVVQYFCWKQRRLSAIFSHKEFLFGARQRLSGKEWRDFSSISYGILKCTNVVEPVVKRMEKDFTLTYFLRRRFWRLSRWPRGLKCSFAVARLLGLWVQIPPWAWKFVCCECYVPSGRGFCVGLIALPEESCWVCVCECVCACVHMCVFVCVSRSVIEGNITSTPTMSR